MAARSASSAVCLFWSSKRHSWRTMFRLVSKVVGVATSTFSSMAFWNRASSALSASTKADSIGTNIKTISGAFSPGRSK
ncbi:hypothetical protein D9M70_654230 [compost metagenome]